MPKRKSRATASKKAPAKKQEREDVESETEQENGTAGKGKRSSSSQSPKNSTRSLKGKRAATKSDSEDEVEIIHSKKSKRGRPSSKAPTKTETKKAPAKPKKVEKKQKEPESESDQEEYEVLKILDVRFKANGKREFEIHWKGYARKDATWEPEEKMDCPDLIKEFMANLEDNHLPRRRMSQRPSTRINTRQSETRQIIHLQRVQTGRVEKRRASAPRSLHMDQTSSSNGMVRNRGRRSTREQKYDWRSKIPAIGSRAIIGTGFVMSLGAAAFFSADFPNIDLSSYTHQMHNFVELIKEKVGYATVGK